MLRTVTTVSEVFEGFSGESGLSPSLFTQRLQRANSW